MRVARTLPKLWSVLLQVVWSMGIFYGYAFLAGLIVWVFCKIMSVEAGLVHLWCIYGGYRKGGGLYMIKL